MESPAQSTIFEQLRATGRITAIELDIWDAENRNPISQDQDPRGQVRHILRRFFTLYGINPTVQFSDSEFKESFITEVTNVVTRYYPTVSARAFELAIELNLTNAFGIEKKPEVYGDRVTAGFLVEVLNIYMGRKGKIMQKLERMIPEPEKTVDQVDTDRELREMMIDDIKAANGGAPQFRLPESYYGMLIRSGEIEETEEMVNEYRNRALKIMKALKGIAKRKEASPLSLKDLDITRNFLTNHTKSLAAIAKTEALADYITKQNKGGL